MLIANDKFTLESDTIKWQEVYKDAHCCNISKVNGYFWLPSEEITTGSIEFWHNGARIDSLVCNIHSLGIYLRFKGSNQKAFE